MKRVIAAAVIAFALAASMFGTHSTQASPRDDGWINIAGKPIRLDSARQDPLSGKTTDQALPLDKLPGQAREILTTPVSTALDTFWSGTAAPFLCSFATGFLNGQGNDDFHLHDTSCVLAQTGTTTASDQGGKVVLRYYLPQNVIKSSSSTPITCAAGHGTFLCPTDPRVSLTVDIELQATIATPGSACDAHVDPFTVQVHNVTLDSQDLTADIAFDAASLWASITGTDYVSMAQDMISQGVATLNASAGQMQQAVTTKIADFTSSLCHTILPSLPSASDLWLLTASVDPTQGIVFQLLDEPPVPSFLHPELTAAEPSVTAGNRLRLHGDYFPPNGGTVTLTLSGGTRLGEAAISAEGTFAVSAVIPADTAPGSYRIHAAAGAAQADADIEVLARGGQGVLTVTWQGQVYTSIDTDNPFTLSGANFTPGTMTIHLDTATGTLIGTVTVAADGTFTKDLQVNADQIGNRGGQHKLVAVQNGNVQADPTYTFVLPEVIH